MVHVTRRAKEALLVVKRDANVDSRDVGLRLVVGAGGALGLVPDRPKAGDEVVTHGDAIVLLVDPEVSALTVAGRIVDCRPPGAGRTQFVLRRGVAGDRRPSSAA